MFGLLPRDGSALESPRRGRMVTARQLWSSSRCRELAANGWAAGAGVGTGRWGQGYFDGDDEEPRCH